MSSLFPTAKSDPELHPFRSGLVFGFFNALTWQIAIGTPMVLFAERLGATSFQVGLAYSFVFVLTPVQVLATTLLPHYGFKRVTLGGWSARSLFLVLPLMLTVLAPAVGKPWMVATLIWSVFFFCLFRSVGAGAMTAWFFGFLPPHVRGRYFASDQLLSGIAGVGTLIACAALFSLLPIYTALLIQYVIALTGSTLSYYSLKQLPDIEKPAAVGLGAVLRATPRHLFAPSGFRHYVWLAVWYAVITTPIPPFAAYYLKVGAQLSAGQIMVFEVFRYCGVIGGAWLIRRRIDTTGARPFFLVALGLSAAVAGFWWLYLRQGLGGTPALFAIYFLVGLGAVCWTVANLNYLPKVVPAQERALFVSIHGAATACIGGCSPVLWGLFLKNGEVGGAPGINAGVFQWFFVTVFGSSCVLFLLVARLSEDTKTPIEPIVIGHAILNPFRAASYLVNLIDLQSLRRGEPAKSEKKMGSGLSAPSELVPPGRAPRDRPHGGSGARLG